MAGAEGMRIGSKFIEVLGADGIEALVAMLGYLSTLGSHL